MQSLRASPQSRSQRRWKDDYSPLCRPICVPHYNQARDKSPELVDSTVSLERNEGDGLVSTNKSELRKPKYGFIDNA